MKLASGLLLFLAEVTGSASFGRRAPAWETREGTTNPICVVRGGVCVNSTHFIHTHFNDAPPFNKTGSSGADFRGCLSEFSFNTRHVREFRGGSVASYVDPLLATSKSVAVGEAGEAEGGETRSGVGGGAAVVRARVFRGDARGDVPGAGAAMTYLFDTGVDRAVHGHFMSKLLQLWDLHVTGERISHVVFFRREFCRACKGAKRKRQQQQQQQQQHKRLRRTYHGNEAVVESALSMGPAQLQLLAVVVRAIDAAQRPQGQRNRSTLRAETSLWNDSILNNPLAYLLSLSTGENNMASSSSDSTRRFNAGLLNDHPNPHLRLIWSDDIVPTSVLGSSISTCAPSSDFPPSRSKPPPEYTPAGSLTNTLCLGLATVGSGYENTVGSKGAADSFRALVDVTVRRVKNDGLTSPAAPPPLPFVTAEEEEEQEEEEDDEEEEKKKVGCPLPRIVHTKRGRGSSASRAVVNREALDIAVAMAGERLGLNLPQVEEATVNDGLDLKAQVALFRSFGLLLSPHSSSLKNLALSHSHTAVVELQPGVSMTNAFLIDVHHFQVHYEISRNHTPANCPGAKPSETEEGRRGSTHAGVQGNSTPAPHQQMVEGSAWVGVKWDGRRAKWKASVRVGGKENALGFYDSAEEAARKHDRAALDLGRGGTHLNFPLLVQLAPSEVTTANNAEVAMAPAAGAVALASSGLPASSAVALAKRWAWRCDMAVHASLLADAIVKVLTAQTAACPELWQKKTVFVGVQ